MRFGNHNGKCHDHKEIRRSTRRDLAELANSLRIHLNCQALMGLEWLPVKSHQSRQHPFETLEMIRADLGECTRCPLHSSRSHIVFGEGNCAAPVVFVGEGPGYEEDRQGKPFVGAAGKLLDRIISAMGWRRHEIYICNVIKCRPPGNRNPLPEEIAVCGPFLRRQILAIQPQVVMALGSFAAQFLLSSQQPISKLRNRVHSFEGIPVVPTYHPAYLLRNPLQKRRVWEDIQLLQSLKKKDRDSIDRRVQQGTV
jgi:DNA polymerase